MRKRFHIRDVILNGAVIFASYLLAVVVRYRILRSEPGVDALSAPYLLIALAYSILLATTFDYEEPPRWLQSESNITSLYQIISKNAIGCLLLLSAFYMAGIVYFSRWALLLFWVISSFGLVVLKEIIYSRIARRRASGEDCCSVLIIGSGRMAEKYIQSIAQNPQLGIRIAGYFGEDGRLGTDTDSIFNKGEYSEPVIQWFGAYDPAELRRTVKEQNIDELLIAEQGFDDRAVEEILLLAHENGIRTNMSIHYSLLVAGESKIKDLGSVKLVGLNESAEEKTNFTTGVVVTAAFLLLMMVMKKFNMGAMDTLKGFEAYRCIIFALFSFFLFLNLGRMFERKKRGLIKRVILSFGVSICFVLVFETVYSSAVADNIRLDTLVVTAVMFACLIFAGVAEMIAKSDFILIE